MGLRPPSSVCPWALAPQRGKLTRGRAPQTRQGQPGSTGTHRLVGCRRAAGLTGSPGRRARTGTTPVLKAGTRKGLNRTADLQGYFCLMWQHTAGVVWGYRLAACIGRGVAARLTWICRVQRKGTVKCCKARGVPARDSPASMSFSASCTSFPIQGGVFFFLEGAFASRRVESQCSLSSGAKQPYPAGEGG